MEIRYIPHEDLDRQRWDNCITAAVNGNIYGYSWFLDIVAPEWDALVEGNYETVFPLTRRKKFGICYLYQPDFCQQLGIFSQGHLTTEKAEQFLEKIPEYYRLVEIQLNSFNPVSLPSFEVRQRPNLELELISPYETLRQGYSQNLRRNLKNATESGWIVTEDVHPESLIAIFKNKRGKELKNLNASTYKNLLRLVTACRKRDCLLILGTGKNRDAIHAGAIFLRSHHKIILLFSASDSEARSHGGMPLLIDSVIRQYSGTRTVLDFEGSENPDLARFYAGFGAKKFEYPFIRRNTLPALVKWLKKRFR